MKIQNNLLKSFKEKYYGSDGVKNTEKLENSNDAKWIGSSIDLFLEDAKELKCEKKEIEQKMINNPEYIQKGQYDFLDLYRLYEIKCIDAKWSIYFNANYSDVTQSFILLKKHLLMYTKNHIQDYYAETLNDIPLKKLKKFKKTMFLYFNVQMNINKTYNHVKVLWNLAVAELRSESIVESILSSLKKIYRSDRVDF